METLVWVIHIFAALGTIGSLQVFDQVKVMTTGGPLNATMTPVYSIYDEAFNQQRFGLASSMAAVLFVIALVFIYRSFYAMRIPEEKPAAK